MIGGRRVRSVLLGAVLSVASIALVGWVALSEEIEAFYYDDFDSIFSGWDVDDGDTGSVGYRNGRYEVRITKKNWMWWAWVPNVDIPDSFAVEVRGKDARGSSCAYGIIWGVDNSNYYVFRISGNQFSVKARLNGEWVRSPVDWQDSSAIKESRDNSLRVIVDGSDVEVFINGRRCGGFEMRSSSDLAAYDQSPGTVTLGFGDSWRVGLVGTAWSNPPITILFDSIALFELPSDASGRPTINIDP